MQLNLGTKQQDMPFDANRKLAAALYQPTPVVLRNYEAMMPCIKAFVLELTQAVAIFREIKLTPEPHDHSESCEACTVIENMQVRYSHDLGQQVLFLAAGAAVLPAPQL